MRINSPGVYWVTVNLLGCEKTDSIKVIATTVPQFNLTSPQYLCPGLTLLLSPGLDNVTYNWHDGSTKAIYMIKQTGLYYVDVTNNCGTVRDSVVILNGNCKVYVPSAFTPNNDNLNDNFRVEGTTLINEFDLKVFDRSGQLMFHTNNKNGFWNGEYKGIKMPSGVYVYIVRYNEINNSEMKNIHGVVTLLR